MNVKFAFCLLAFVLVPEAIPQQRFHAGKVIPEFGKVASVESDMPVNSSTKLRICFDVAGKSGQETINQTFDSAARFINLNVEAGAQAKNVKVAIVVHGQAAMDVTDSKFYGSRNSGRGNHNAKVIATLQENGTTFYICGQSAAGLGIEKADLLPGVKMAHSAMTAHVLLRQNGFALCPF